MPLHRYSPAGDVCVSKGTMFLYYTLSVQKNQPFLPIIMPRLTSEKLKFSLGSYLKSPVILVDGVFVFVLATDSSMNLICRPSVIK